MPALAEAAAVTAMALAPAADSKVPTPNSQCTLVAKKMVGCMPCRGLEARSSCVMVVSPTVYSAYPAFAIGATDDKPASPMVGKTAYA